MGSYPAYLELHESGELARRAEALRESARACRLCPRECGVDRSAGERGYCGAPWGAKVASHNAHHGEEPPISGSRGSGTVFFAHCTMHCLFCQNYPISQLGHGREVSDRELAGFFLELQRRKCHNLNLVTPTHVAHAFVSALEIAAGDGFRLPVVYNTSGYERLETLGLLDGIVDIYMPDIKYGNPEKALRYSDAGDYVERNLEALEEMQRQVGDLEMWGSGAEEGAPGEPGIARRGLLVRHLVLPGSEEESVGVLKKLRDRVSDRAYVSLMSQYFPAHKALERPPLDRRVDPATFRRVAEWVESTDLRGWIQSV